MAFTRCAWSVCWRLKKIASDLHDDIGTGLTHIGLLTEMALQKSGVKQLSENENNNLVHEQESSSFRKAVDELSSAIARIGDIARELSVNMSDVVWSINPRHDSVEALQRRLKVFAHEICGAKDIALEFEVSKHLTGIKLHPEIRSNLLLLAKEAFFNSNHFASKLFCL